MFIWLKSFISLYIIDWPGDRIVLLWFMRSYLWFCVFSACVRCWSVLSVVGVRDDLVDLSTDREEYVAGFLLTALKGADHPPSVWAHTAYHAKWFVNEWLLRKSSSLPSTTSGRSGGSWHSEHVALSPAFDVAIVLEKKQLSASLFFVRQRLISWLQLEQNQVQYIEFPRSLRSLSYTFFCCVFFFAGDSM